MKASSNLTMEATIKPSKASKVTMVNTIKDTSRIPKRNTLNLPQITTRMGDTVRTVGHKDKPLQVESRRSMKPSSSINQSTMTSGLAFSSS